MRLNSKRRSGDQKPKGLPTWIKDHFKQSLDSIETLMQLVHISERGI
jgi:hypothetical protein